VAAGQRQLLLDWLKPFRLPATRQRRLLHDTGFRWRDEISRRLDRWRKRCLYHWRFHNYTLTG
jgi:hypothetical protein